MSVNYADVSGYLAAVPVSRSGLDGEPCEVATIQVLSKSSRLLLEVELQGAEMGRFAHLKLGSRINLSGWLMVRTEPGTLKRNLVLVAGREKHMLYA